MFSLIEKDIKVLIKSSGGILVLLGPILIVVGLLFYLKNALGGSEELFELSVGSLIPNISAIAMIIPGGGVIETVINADRDNRVNQVLISDGMDMRKVWLSKVASACVTGYFGVIISFITLCITYFVMTGSLYDLHVSVVFKYFLVYPCLSVVFLEIMAFVMWVIRAGAFIVGFFPSLLSMGLIYLNLLEISGEIKIDGTILGIVTGIAIVIGVIVLILVDRIPKEYIVNIETK
ncbi:MAG: hypothetical protein K6F97_03610 [Lachnospiraceae bacterium]|nr:hypothetical protein [Lachnospiraceae bacterium]